MLDFSFAAVICVIEDMEKIREEFKGEEATKGRFTFGQVFDYISDGCYPEGLESFPSEREPSTLLLEMLSSSM